MNQAYVSLIVYWFDYDKHMTRAGATQACAPMWFSFDSFYGQVMFLYPGAQSLQKEKIHREKSYVRCLSAEIKNFSRTIIVMQPCMEWTESFHMGSCIMTWIEPNHQPLKDSMLHICFPSQSILEICSFSHWLWGYLYNANGASQPGARILLCILELDVLCFITYLSMCNTASLVDYL